MTRRPALQKASERPKKVSGTNPIGLGRDQASSSGTFERPDHITERLPNIMKSTIATSRPTTHRQRGREQLPGREDQHQVEDREDQETQDQLSNQSRIQSPGVNPGLVALRDGPKATSATRRRG